MLPVQKSCTINCTEEYDFLIRCLTFLLKTKNQSTCKTTEVRMLTTAMKIEIKLVVTMISPWIVDRIINIHQH